MIHDILREAGCALGAWLSTGVYINGERQPGELGPWAQIANLLRSNQLDAGLQELEAATVLAAGLPPRVYPLAVVTTLCGNNETCLVAPETQLVRRGLRVVSDAVHHDGTIVTNADDFAVVEATSRGKIRRVMFALKRENPALQRHLATGGIGAWVEDGAIGTGCADGFNALVDVAAIPATLEGTLIFQVQNALAASAVAHELGIEKPVINRVLAAFEPHPERLPAACNILRFNGATIVVDAPSQIWSLRMLARGIRNQPRRRTIVVSGAFPGLPDEDVAEAGRLLGNLGALVVLHGENASDARLQAFKAGISSAASAAVVLTVSNETRAVDHVLNIVGNNDVALVMADDPAVVLAHLWPAPSISMSSQLPRPERTAR
jgi:cyanophycin synthetase